MTFPVGIYFSGECNYAAIDAVNISSLLVLAKSPKHYRLRTPYTTKAMSLGTAAHCATLEPERFARDYVAWDRRSENGNLCPRNGQHWYAFRMLHSGREIVTEDELDDALEIARAVRSNRECAKILECGAPEVTLVWVHERTGILCKGRVDWINYEHRNKAFSDLKTAADITPRNFLRKSTNLSYHVRMAWYHDAAKLLLQMPETETLETLLMAVESGKPHDVAVYEMDEEVLENGRVEYEQLMDKLKFAIDSDQWPGISGVGRIRYVLPRWAVTDPENEGDADLDFGEKHD